jgi:hypothetical protein
MPREKIVHEVVVAVRAVDWKGKWRSDQCRNLRDAAIRMAEKIAPLDEVTQRIIIGMCAHRQAVADGTLLEGFIDEAKVASQALSSARGPWIDQWKQDRGERPARLLDITKEMFIRSRGAMDPKTRLPKEAYVQIRARADGFAESIMELDPDVQALVMEMCVHGGIAHGNQLQQLVDQAKMAIDVLREPVHSQAHR